jgi:polysaccharide export outer membrane protein
MIRKLFPLLFITFLLASCANKKKLIYFQNKVPSNTAEAMSYSPIFKKDDLLSIVVTSTNPVATAPFNLMQGASSAGVGQDAGGISGYLIDESGEINFPYLGKIQFLGLTRSEATKMLEEKLKMYLDKPVVQIQIQNFRITLLGDITRPGIYPINNERITIIEAIGLGGDLAITGKRMNVKVIRDRNGEKTEYLVDLTKTDVFTSPVYYLEQNDIVYVEPNQTKLTGAVLNPALGIVFSFTSVLIATLGIVFR